ncbi:MAG TPA: FAD-binding oxidoreductase [Alphaproteobacteria bacterium]|nr:FAD-binding oxidoreductase [Alphaproteobacteria bacterium]
MSTGRDQAIGRIKDAVGPKGWIDDAEGRHPYLAEMRDLYRGTAFLVVRPATTSEVAAVVRICADAGIGIVPQGGNTGLVGGAVSLADQIVLATDRLDRIRNVDPLDHTITVEAGVVLQRVQEAANAVDRLFPLSLGAEGSCRIGGNISTNAGGTGVLRYGNMRELVLGLEAVLPDGSVWDGLRALRKDNTGYDLKQLFIGAEGTLGVVTAAVLRLFPKPRRQETAFVAVVDPAAAVQLLAHAKAGTGDAVTAFELIQRLGLDFALRHVSGVIDPLAAPHPWYVLIQASSGAPDETMRDRLEAVLGEALEDGLVLDAAIAASEAQAGQFWRIREAVVEGQRYEGGSIKHDVSIPVSRVPRFLDEATAAVEKRVPGVRVCAFGHVGDGNIHFNLTQPVGMDKGAYLALWHEVNRIVHDIVVSLDGSISAEHGIGLLKRDELAMRKSAVELAMMRKIKQALDPKGIMNAGKML